MDLVEDTPAAADWMKQTISANSSNKTFGRLASSVIWSDATGPDGKLLVSIDPAAVAAKINATAFPLLMGHDPGRPIGKVLAADVFKSPTGETFLAALLGFYDGGLRVGFRDLGLDPDAEAPPPTTLPDLPADFSILLAADTKEIEIDWLKELIGSIPIPIELQERSHNALEVGHELILVSVLFATLLWNPFVTTFSQEASKDAYAAVRGSLKRLLARLAERRNPIIEMQSYHRGCYISFMLRGRDIARHYKAYDSMPEAAARAAQLVAKMLDAELSPIRLVYEFHPTADVWHPAFAELSDGQLISDNTALVAVEQMPSGLSLGLELKGP